jgi:RimJ/RimL family protein N-acetyltransferase
MLRALDVGDMEHIRLWRNESLDTLRTPFPLTKEQQEDWYRSEVCDRRSRSRFFAIEDGSNILVGYGGIENIQWENSIGEISLLISPRYRGKSMGTLAASEILREAFWGMNLHTVYAECYSNNKAVGFWRRIFVRDWGGSETILPNRKYCQGQYFDSHYFSASAR